MAERLDRVCLTLRLMLGALFLVGGMVKVQDPFAFARDISNYQLLPEAAGTFVGWYAPWVELIVGACLLSGLATRAAAVLAATMSIVFAFFVSSALIRGLDVTCGCFSGASRVSFLHLIVDIVMLMTSCSLVRTGGRRFSLDRLFDSNRSPDRPGLARVTLIGTSALCLVNLTYVLSIPPAAWSPTQLRSATGKGTLPNSASLREATVVFTPNRIDLGTIKQEESSSVTATYTNRSSVPVTIVGVDSSCGCTEPKLGKYRLEPGESSQLDVTYDPGTNRGKIEQEVRLYIEGRSQPELLPVTAFVQPAVEVSPSVLELEVGKPGSVTLTSQREGLEISAVRLNSPPPNLRILRVLPSGENAVVEVSLTAPLPAPENGTSVWPLHLEVRGGYTALVYIKNRGGK